MSQATHVNSQTFQQEVLQSPVPVLVDFYASWCGPCRLMGPVVDRLAREVGDTARVVKVDVDESPDLAEQFGVSSIPAFVVIHGGKVAARHVGVTAPQQLAAMIQLATPRSPAASRA